MRWLIVLDGSARSEQAAVFAASLFQSKEDDILLLTAGEAENAPERLQNAFGRTPRLKRVPSANLPDSIAEAAAETQAELVVYGSRGRRGWSRLLLGSVAAYLERRLGCSLLVVRGEPRPVRKILIASSLYPGGLRPVEMAGRLAQRTGASVTLLHVMSQLPIHAEAPETPLQATAEEAITLETREGVLLAKSLALLEASGIPARAVLRHGLVLDELTAEMRDGGYDLLVIGGHRSPADLPFGNLLTEDVAEAILMATRAPLLIA